MVGLEQALGPQALARVSRRDYVAEVLAVRAREDAGIGATQIAPLGLSIDQIPNAYAMQDELIRRLENPINPQIGWKTGFSTKAGRAPLGINEPGYGPLFASGMVSSGAIHTKNFAGLLIEQEIVIVMAEDVSENLSAEELIKAVKSVHLGFEMPSKRFTGATGAPNGPSAADMIVDGLASHSFALGPALPIEMLSSTTMKMEMNKDGALFAQGDVGMLDNGAGGLGPLQALAWLVEKLVARGKMLKSGQLIYTGAVPGPTPFSKGTGDVTEFVASAETFGQAHLRVKV